MLTFSGMVAGSMSEVEKQGIRRRVVWQSSVAAGCAATALPARAAEASTGITASIDVAKTGEPISKYLYGSFSEHIQGFMYDALWAEVLHDRKFFYAIGDQDPSAQK